MCLLTEKSIKPQKHVNHKRGALEVVLVVTLLNWISNIQKMTKNTSIHSIMNINHSFCVIICVITSLGLFLCSDFHIRVVATPSELT